ncbi:hypothetical protein B0T19DRAFT_402316 [Cercophora scortea]|uniref:RRM domain-containing protein n=1 Tax=Cercophora scortea TaxID=314031 RepID=A0AAE0IFI7_9PEZI|nr:hypothetical protein B0T19DRAFT_402316 [Cercophora scortea]
MLIHLGFFCAAFSRLPPATYRAAKPRVPSQLHKAFAVQRVVADMIATIAVNKLHVGELPLRPEAEIELLESLFPTPTLDPDEHKTLNSEHPHRDGRVCHGQELYLRESFHGLFMGYNYRFNEYDDPGAAERAMQTLNGCRVHQSHLSELIRVFPDMKINDERTRRRTTTRRKTTRRKKKKKKKKREEDEDEG